MHYSGVQVPLCMMLIIQKNTMTIKKLMDTPTTPILRSMYGQVKLLSASALRFKRKFVVRLGRIKRFTNIWKTVTADTVKYDETGRDEPWNRSSLARSSATLYQLQSPQPAQGVVETASIRFVQGELCRIFNRRRVRAPALRAAKKRFTGAFFATPHQLDQACCQRILKRMNLRWPKRFAALLHLDASPAQPAEVPSSQDVKLQREYLCAGCRNKRKSPHQVRAGRARARTASRDQRGRFLAFAATKEKALNERVGSTHQEPIDGRAVSISDAADVQIRSEYGR